MNVTPLDVLAVGGAGLAAGGINAMAGGGTLIAFPCLVALGVPTVSANVTVTVGQTPGYLAGAWSQRADLGSGLRSSRRLAGAAALGAVAGALLLQVTPDGLFKAVVPYLIVLACVALVVQDRLRDRLRVRARAAPSPPPVAPSSAAPVTPAPAPVGGGSARLLPVIVAVGGVYGGFFGAGLGIMLLAVLGLFSDAGMVRNNAVKQVLAFVINVIAALVFAVGHHVAWALVPFLAVGSVVGGVVGGRTVRIVNPLWLRAFVVAFGLAVAVYYWVT